MKTSRHLIILLQVFLVIWNVNLQACLRLPKLMIFQIYFKRKIFVADFLLYWRYIWPWKKEDNKFTNKCKNQPQPCQSIRAVTEAPWRVQKMQAVDFAICICANWKVPKSWAVFWLPKYLYWLPPNKYWLLKYDARNSSFLVLHWFMLFFGASYIISMLGLFGGKLI